MKPWICFVYYKLCITILGQKVKMIKVKIKKYKKAIVWPAWVMHSIDFQNSFTTGKRRKFPINWLIIFPHTLSILPHYLREFKKFKFVVKLPNKIKTRIIFVKNESFIHIAEWILLLSQQLLKLSNVCSHTLRRRPRHSSIALSITLWSIPCQMCSKRCYYLLWFLTYWTPIINRRSYKDGKFEVCSRLYLPIIVKT